MPVTNGPIVLVSLNRERMPCPVIPLGIGYVGGELLRAGFAVKVVDLAMASDPDADTLAGKVAALSPSAVGLSMRNIDSVSWPDVTWYLPEIRRVVAALRRALCAPLFIGGSAFTICPEETLDDLELDLGLCGEGERGAVRLVRDVILGGGSPAEVPGAVYRDSGGRIRVVPTSAAAAADMPPPGPISPEARDLLNIPAYLEAGAAVNIQTKRGCPLRCTYCVYPVLEGRRFRLRTPVSVTDEMAASVETYGARRFTFVDNIFNLPVDHAKGICREMIRRRLAVRWEAYLHPAGVDDELLGLMADSGIMGLEFTPDSGSARMLESYRKGIRIEDLERTAAQCRRRGLPYCLYFLLGGPGETWETLDETFTLADRLEPTAVVATLGVRILPGTDVFRAALAGGIVKRGAGLLEPAYYVSPDVREGFTDGILARVENRPSWIVPSLGVNYSPELFKMARRFGPEGTHWRHVGRLTSSHRRPVRDLPR